MSYQHISHSEWQGRTIIPLLIQLHLLSTYPSHPHPTRQVPQIYHQGHRLSAPSSFELMTFSPSLPTMNEEVDSAPTVKTEDLVETKVVVTEAVQALYEEEKLLIILNKKPPILTGQIKSSIWKNVFHIDWEEMHHRIKLRQFSCRNTKGLPQLPMC